MSSKKFVLVVCILITAVATLNRCDNPTGENPPERWNYGPWDYYKLKIEARALYMFGPDSGWACADGPAFIKYNGTKWFLFENFGNEESYAFCRDMDFSVPTDGWAVGYSLVPKERDRGKIFHYDGSSWKDVTPYPMRSLYCVAAVAPGDVWVGGDEVIYHYDGTAWEATPFRYGFNVEALSFRAPDTGWAIASANIFHYDGAEWKYVFVHPDARPIDIFFPAPNEGWTAGGNIGPADFTCHPIMHYKDGEWTKTFRAQMYLESVHFAGPDDGWAAGSHVIRYDGNGWHVVTPPGKLYVYDVFTLGGDDVWLACNHGAICRYNPNKK